MAIVIVLSGCVIEWYFYSYHYLSVWRYIYVDGTVGFMPTTWPHTPDHSALSLSLYSLWLGKGHVKTRACRVAVGSTPKLWCAEYLMWKASGTGVAWPPPPPPAAPACMHWSRCASLSLSVSLYAARRLRPTNQPYKSHANLKILNFDQIPIKIY